MAEGDNQKGTTDRAQGQTPPAPETGQPAFKPGDVRGARQAMEPKGAVDHIVGATTIGGAGGDNPQHTAAYNKAIDETLRFHYKHSGLGDFDKLPEDKKDEARERAMRQMPDDLTAQSPSPFVHEFQRTLLHAHFDMIRDQKAPLQDRMASASALAALNPVDKQILAAQQDKWNGMTPEQQRAAVDEAMSTPPGERAQALAQAKKEGRYTGLLDISQSSLDQFAMAAHPEQEKAIRGGQFGATERLRTDARDETVETLKRQLVDSLNPQATEARATSQAVVDQVAKELQSKAGPGGYMAPPGPDAYLNIAAELEKRAEHEGDGQKAAAMRGAAKILKDSGRELTDQEAASNEAIRRGGSDIRRMGEGGTGREGLDAQTGSGIEKRMEARLEERIRSGKLADDAKDPAVLRRELGLTERDLEHLQPAEKLRLAENLKGRLLAFGIVADVAPGLARAVFHLAF